MTSTHRDYRTKDVDMLIASATIIQSAIAEKDFLQAKRPAWADPFFDDIKERIDDAIANILGIDSAKDLRQATQAILAIEASALRDLAEAKIQISEDFKSDKTRRDELLHQLGYVTFHKAAQSGDQEALISLLFRFMANLTPEVKTEITAAGTAATLLDAITAYADQLKDANISQETFKGSRKTITADALGELNAIYSQVISICKIAANLFKDKPHLRDQFSFTAVSSLLRAHSAHKEPPAA